MFLRALVATGPDDVFLAEDAHQRIYGQRLTLSKFGFAVRGRSSRLRLNYRTTAENLNLAQQVLVGADWVDADDQPEDSSGGYRSVRHGPEPRIVHTATLVEEYDRAAELIGGAWIRETQEQGRPLQTIGILVRDRRQRDLVVAALAERRVGVRAVDNQGSRTAAGGADHASGEGGDRVREGAADGGGVEAEPAQGVREPACGGAR